MKERPILFSAPMVRAILAGTKTQTRRIVKPQPHAGVRESVFVPSGLEDGHGRELRCRHGGPGDRLWVRETWADADPRYSPLGPIRYRADGDEQDGVWKWRPSIHMPRAASRIDLEVTGVRVERLQDITEENARAEGVEPDGGGWKNYARDGTPFITAGASFATLWDATYGTGSWASNPWVWVVSFKRAESKAGT